MPKYQGKMSITISQKSNVTSSRCLFCSTKSPISKHVPFTIILNTENHKVLTCEKLRTHDVVPRVSPDDLNKDPSQTQTGLPSLIDENTVIYYTSLTVFILIIQHPLH